MVLMESTSQQPVHPNQNAQIANSQSSNQPINHNSTNQASSQISSSSQTNLDPDPIDFDECLKDSPKFRQALRDNLSNVEILENCMSRTIKQVNNYIETGREHIKAQKDLINSMKLLNASLGNSNNTNIKTKEFKTTDINNNNVTKRVNTLLETLEEIMKLHEIVIDQSARTIGNSLSLFINDDLSKIREARKSFDKISHEYDQALTRYSQPVKKQQDDTENLLIATSTAFSHTSLDLSIQLTALQSKKGHDVLDSLLSFTKAYSAFFHQGSDLFEDVRPQLCNTNEFLAIMQDEFETLIRNLPSKHLLVSNNELKPLCFDNKAQQVHLEGYLFKRASNGFKAWNRRWFILKDHQLLYQKRSDTQPTTMEDDLRLLTVKPVDRADVDRRFCFEVLSSQKSHMLQADSESSRKTWISAIQAGINAAFHDTELKSIPNAPSSHANDIGGGIGGAGSSSWGSQFSFKALNKLNSITHSSGSNNSEHNNSNINNKDSGRASNNSNSGREKLVQKSSNLTSGDDEDEQNSIAYDRIDDQGRSYVQLKDADEDDDINHDLDNRPNSGTRYPSAAAAEPVSHNQNGPETAVVPPAKPQRAYMIILAMPGNEICADCEATQPKWASINLGITLCIECAGIHRSLGVHLSKVRSLTLDTEVWSPEIVQLMLSLGNRSVNAAYLACYREQKPPIDGDSCPEDRENWIKKKYLEKCYMRPPGESMSSSSDDSSVAS